MKNKNNKKQKIIKINKGKSIKPKSVRQKAVRNKKITNNFC